MRDLTRFDLSGKKALVTGAAGGIGKACAVAVAKAGADVAIVDLKDEMGRETVEEIRALGRQSLYIHCDVSDPRQVTEMVKEVVDTLGDPTLPTTTPAYPETPSLSWASRQSMNGRR